MGGLAHYLESEGIPTTQISLVRSHTEKIQPPRALWVPFEFGRPLGAPEQPALQRRVLLAALNLLTADSGPLLEDFPDGAVPESHSSADTEGWVCPVSFARATGDLSASERLLEALHREILELRPWYDRNRQRRARTAVGRFDPERAQAVIAEFARGRIPDEPIEGLSPSAALRLAAQDLKAFYFEAVSAQPGAREPDSGEFSAWFWRETAAGKVLKSIKSAAAEFEDDMIKFTAGFLLVPYEEEG